MTPLYFNKSRMEDKDLASKLHLRQGGDFVVADSLFGMVFLSFVFGPCPCCVII